MHHTDAKFIFLSETSFRTNWVQMNVNELKELSFIKFKCIYLIKIECKRMKLSAIKR